MNLNTGNTSNKGKVNDRLKLTLLIFSALFNKISENLGEIRKYLKKIKIRNF
jgi:hypothetical protein